MAEFLINSQNSAQKGDFTLTFLNVKNLENVVFSRFLLAPQVGLEPTTLRLTAACSAN